MRKLKLAFIGCGGIANWHLGHLINFEDVEFVGFCDLIPQRAQAFVDKTGMGRAYTCAVQMLDETEPEAVYICVPPACHGETEEEVIKRGIHFLVEKPMALSMELASSICDRAQRAGIITAVGFQDRYLGIIQTARDFLQDRKIALISGAWVGGIPGVPWWPKYATSGGQIVEQNIHLFDMLRYLVGEPAKVYCTGRKGLVNREDYDLHDCSSAIVTFQNGVIANIFTGCYFDGAPAFKNGLHFYCTDSEVDYVLRNSVTTITAEESNRVKNEGDHGILEDRTFVNAVKTNNPNLIRSPYSDALKTLAFVLACNESMATGREVLL